MPATLFLIRHGQTPNNAARIFRGPDGANDALDDTGHAQAEALARAFTALYPVQPKTGQPKTSQLRLYASTYLRARQTAQPIADALHIPLQILPGIHEIHTGDWMGRPYSEMQERLHQLIAPDGQFGYPGGESLAGVGKRFHSALLGLKPRGSETVLVVSHGAALVSVLARLLGKDPREAWLSGEFSHGNSAVTELVWHEDSQPELVRLADVSHLQMVSG